MKKKIYLLSMVLVAITLFVTCKKEPTVNVINPSDNLLMSELIISDIFDYETTENINVTISAISNDGSPLSRIKLSFYDSDPINEDGTLNSVSALLYTGATNSNGVLQCMISVPTYLSQLVVIPDFVGIENKAIVDIVEGNVIYTFGRENSDKSFKSIGGIENTNINYTTLGTWDSDGVPDYLTTPDVITQGLLNDINSTLPEWIALPVSHPEYFAYGLTSNLIVEDSSEVWVTFVHEGAGWKNVLGYYTYPLGNPPATVNDINEHILIFPNVSFSGSGGGLTSGDKVFIDTIPANTVVAWFLVANGWNPSTAQVGNGTHVVYSDSYLNPEPDTSLQKHCVLLWDEPRQLFLMGFEDILRNNGGCDNDFNDAVFYATANPIEAINRDTLERIDPSEDTDGDGIADDSEDYPNDPDKAYNNYYPSENTFGTLAFEDLWPGKGDYDFNDVVLGYNFNSITNANNDVVEIEQKIVVRAFGASIHNGFGIEFNTPASNSSVSGGIEAVEGTSKSIIMSFFDTYDILTYPGEGAIGVNTTLGVTYVQPDTIFQTITFTTPVTVAQLGTPPYNPFLRVANDPTHEIHLPDYAPTELAVNSPLFGTNQDDSDFSIGRYYKTENNLPWALNLPVEFDYPIEKVEIVNAHLKFGSWATSNGENYADWYLNQQNYRNAGNIYTH